MIQQDMTTISVCSPRECSAADLADFRRLVEEGGEVAPDTLPALVEQALALAMAYINGRLVGVGAIKRPHEGHRATMFKKAKSLLAPTHFEFELGWFYVSPAARGNRLATKLIQALVPVLEGRAAYSTSRLNNDRMHSSLRKVGFVAEGTPYPSKLNDQEIQLFVCR